MQKHRIVIVGGGSAGMIAASKLASHYKGNIEIIVIYDHSNPGIGVGESLTPIFFSYLRDAGIPPEELIRHIGATFKIGLQFKNWMNDGRYFYHGFQQFNVPRSTNLGAPYDLVNGIYDLDYMYPAYYYENCRVPITKSTGNMNGSGQNVSQVVNGMTMHIDSTKFSVYIENKFKDKITVIDDVVVDVIKKNGNIKELILKKNGKYSGDFYIDASGFECALMKHLKNKWIDMTDWLPINKFIPNPVPLNINAIDKLPPYTTAEGTDNGWILQVPLQNRYGTGYLYCSEFTSDDEAFDKFSIWTRKNHGVELKSNKILSFKSGYWKKQWVGNCMVIGLASGFAEPLEATNLHHTVSQMNAFARVYNYEKMLEYDKDIYNDTQASLYKNIYLYLRHCYVTNRTDSKFWKYMTNSTPKELKNLHEKIKYGYLTGTDINGPMFIDTNFTCVSYGYGHYDKECIKKQLTMSGIYKQAQKISNTTHDLRNKERSNHIDSKEYVLKLLKNPAAKILHY